MAAGAADIPVTRLLGQSPAGLSATGDSDTRNYYDMISARQEIDLRPQLERLDRLVLRSPGVDPAALTFKFRPLWQMDAASKATTGLADPSKTTPHAREQEGKRVQLLQARCDNARLRSRDDVLSCRCRADGGTIGT